MTDIENEKDFARFSELLDLNDFHSETKEGEDWKALVGLREALRDDSQVPELPEDFTGSTVSRVLERHQAMPGWKRAVVSWSPFLTKSAFSFQALTVTLGLVAILVGSGHISRFLMGGLGLLFFLFAGVLRLGQSQLDRGLPLMPSKPWALSSWLKHSKALPYYTMPALSALALSMTLGAGIRKLGSFSYSFKNSQSSLEALSIGFGFCVFLLVGLALKPTLKAKLFAMKGSPKLHLLHNAFYGLALWCLGTIGHQAYTLKWFGLGSFRQYGTSLAAILLAAVVLALISVVVDHRPEPSMSLREARRSTLASLLVALLSISGCLAIFYQLHLTREILDPDQFQATIAEVEAWVDEQMAIPESENGWLEVKHFMVRDDIDAGLSEGVDQKLKILGQYSGSGIFEENPETPEYAARLRKTWPDDKETFLQELPRLKKAFEKPHFSSTVTEAADGYSIENLVPNFILMRAISQGLGLLTEEALLEQETDKALEYALLDLEWSHRSTDSCRTLIGTMIRIAMLRINLPTVEKLAIEGKLDSESLRKLQMGLESAQLERDALTQAMRHEVYLFEKTLREAQTDKFWEKPNASHDGDLGFLSYIPKGYLESERKAYINYQLARISESLSPGTPDRSTETDINPFNIAASAIVPRTNRAQAQFLASRSAVDAVSLIIALERYQRKYAGYPEKLENLVPEFIDRVPQDSASPRPWKSKEGFLYEPRDTDYLLISESSLYKEVSMSRRQVFGHDGYYDENRD